MAYAKETADGNSRAREFSSLSEFMRETGRDRSSGRTARKRDWHDDVKENIDRARQEAQRLREEPPGRGDF